VLITGIGGGVALFALKYAVAVGARVFVTSSSEEKLKKAIGFGAAGGVNYKTDGWQKTLQGLMPGGYGDVIIDGAGGEDNWKMFLRVIGQGGIIVNYGATASISCIKLIYSRRDCASCSAFHISKASRGKRNHDGECARV
jgi:zinc-binding alcohol dehydrogenase/oxidoreductase